MIDSISFQTALREDSLQKSKLEIPGPGFYEFKDLIGNEGQSKSILG